MSGLSFLIIKVAVFSMPSSSTSVDVMVVNNLRWLLDSNQYAKRRPLAICLPSPVSHIYNSAALFFIKNSSTIAKIVILTFMSLGDFLFSTLPIISWNVLLDIIKSSSMKSTTKIISESLMNLNDPSVADFHTLYGAFLFMSSSDRGSITIQRMSLLPNL